VVWARKTSSTARDSYAKVYGKGVEPLRLAAAEPKAWLASEDSLGIEETSPSGDPSGPEMWGARPGVGQSWGNPDARGTGEDQVEAALARALDRASEAGRFDVVAQLARELEARRLAHLTNDVAFTDARGASRRAVMTDGRNLCMWCRGGRQPDRGPE
jgi:hypothetical protein